MGTCQFRAQFCKCYHSCSALVCLLLHIVPTLLSRFIYQSFYGGRRRGKGECGRASEQAGAPLGWPSADWKGEGRVPSVVPGDTNKFNLAMWAYSKHSSVGRLSRKLEERDLIACNTLFKYYY